MRRLQVRLCKEHGSRLQIEGNPHITLKQAFPVAEVEPFERHFDALVGEVEPFEVRVSGVGFFEEGVVFLDVVPSSPLCALRERVLRDLSVKFGVTPFPVEAEGYRFHATIAHGLPRAHFDHVRRSMSMNGESLEFRFPCVALGLLLQVGRDWITYKSSALARSQ
jgi:2'-5' RNA ligase